MDDAFYLDWNFWTVITAAIAVILSQLPPIYIWFKKAKIDLELYSKIALSHKVGNPNLEIHLLIANNGGRKIRIKGMSASIERDNQKICELPAQNYHQTPNDQNTILLTSFSLQPNEEWGHSVNLLNYFDRETEKEYLGIEAKMKADYLAKKDTLNDQDDQLIELAPEHVQKAEDFFAERFVWLPGEYKLTIKIQTDTRTADISKDFKFILFETQSEQLSEIVPEYKYGAGIWWEPTNRAAYAVVVDISEA